MSKTIESNQCEYTSQGDYKCNIIEKLSDCISNADCSSSCQCNDGECQSYNGAFWVACGNPNLVPTNDYLPIIPQRSIPQSIPQSNPQQTNSNQNKECKNWCKKKVKKKGKEKICSWEKCNGCNFCN